MFLNQPIAAIAAEVMEPPAEVSLTGLRLNALVIGPLIGAGGMGRVYRGRDTELQRDVAIKVLPPEFAHDADRVARFGREARVLASLNHPNIAQIHGFETADGATAIVMELVEGETLSDRIARGSIPLDESLLIAKQIAEALEAAHEQGVIHRDLKPANIKVRADGTVKVLDFGLAKSMHQSPDEADERSNDGALSATPGFLLGTAAYMAPEQATHKPVDRRADLWALGCVIFEMLTAQPAFAADTPSGVLGKVLEHEPNWEALPGGTPAPIRRLLQRCLEKNARRRLDSAAVVRLEIDETTTRSSAAVASGEHSGGVRRSTWWPLAWAASGALVALIVSTLVGERSRPAGQAPANVSSLIVEGLPLGTAGIHFAVAPSGRTVVFAGNRGGTRVLFRRDLDRIDAEPILGTTGGSDVFFSPDSRSIGFETRSELWTAALDGGSPARLIPNHALRGGTWGDGGRVVVGRVGSGLWMAAAGSGEPRQLTVPDEGERHELPQLLPGGRAVLFTILSTKGPSRAATYLFETGETRTHFEGTAARYVGSGHVVFGQLGKLWAVAFDVGSLQTRGVARPVRDDVLWSVGGYPQFAVEADMLAYVRSTEESTRIGKTRPILVDRRGKEQSLPIAADNYMFARFSPAGDRLALQVGTARDLWTYDLRLATFAKLTADRIIAFSAPAWTPDGSRIIVTTWFDGEVGLGWFPADGSGPVEVLVSGGEMRSYERTHPVMLPDGSGVILTGLAPGASIEDLLMVRLTGDKRLETLLRAQGVERNPAIAPNGRFIAYNSDESGRPEVYVRPFPHVGARRWQISTEGGAGPVWTRGGREIVYGDRQGRIMAAEVRGNSAETLDFAKPEPLFTFGTGGTNGLDRNFDVTGDGERFLFLVSDDGPASAASVNLVLIQNWVSELTRLVPPEP